MKGAPLFATGLLLLGCASSDPRYFSLEIWPGQVVGGPRRSVVVRSTEVSRYLQRDEIVRRSQDGRVTVDDRDWWSETLRTMLQRVLAADLAQRLPDAEVLGTEALGGEGATITLSVERFEPRSDGVLALAAHLAIQVAGHDRLLRRIAIEVMLPGRTTDDQVRAMSQAIGQVADVAASALARAP